MSNFTLKESGKAVVLTVGLNRLDAAEAAAFKQALVSALDQGKNRVVIDLTAVDFMDSSGLSSLLSCRKSIGPEGRLALTGVGAKPRQLFKITKLDQGVLPIFDQLEQALAAVSE